MQFNRQNLDKFRTDFQKAVQELEQKYGVAIQMGNISFTADQFTSKLTVTNTDNMADGVDGKMAQMKVEFDRYCYKFGLEPKDYGREFTHGGKKYKIVGVSPKSRKSPILVEELSSGKIYKISKIFIG